jgi:hypothetical protein
MPRTHPHGSRTPKPPSDPNAVIGGYLRDLAFAQTSPQKMYGYKRAAAAILSLPEPLPSLVGADGSMPRISGIGPASTRVIREILERGESPTVEAAVDRAGRRADIERRRTLRGHVLSRAAVNHVLSDPRYGEPAVTYRGDLQFHTEWSDGSTSVAAMARACIARGYAFAAVTDHSYGLKIAGGMSMVDAARQRRAIDAVNARRHPDFHLFQGIEANIDMRGDLDLTDAEAATFDLVLAAPHSRLRKDDDQTARMVAAVAHPSVRILAHPRGRMSGSRTGIPAARIVNAWPLDRLRAWLADRRRGAAA